MVKRLKELGMVLLIIVWVQSALVGLQKISVILSTLAGTMKSHKVSLLTYSTPLEVTILLFEIYKLKTVKTTKA